MNTNKLITSIAFLLMAAAQLYVPWRMINTREDVIEGGTEYWFRTAPVDPNDPFRGKYVTLSFLDNSWVVPDPDAFVNGDHVYVSVGTDSAGFARIDAISLTAPTDHTDYFSTTISYILRDSISRVYVNFPFDRFYMEETKAPMADSLYMEASRDTQRTMLAMVMVHQGHAVLKDVILDGISIRDWTKTPPARTEE